MQCAAQGFSERSRCGRVDVALLSICIVTVTNVVTKERIVTLTICSLIIPSTVPLLFEGVNKNDETNTL